MLELFHNFQDSLDWYVHPKANNWMKFNLLIMVGSCDWRMEIGENW